MNTLNDKKALKSIVFSHPLHWIAFGCGAGLSPIAPGTVGSLLAIPFIMYLSTLPTWIYFVVTLLVIGIGTVAAGWSSAILKAEDPRGIVIDEIAGMLLMMLFVPIHPWSLLLGFVLFRIFDIAKPWPIGWADRRVKGGVGIMLDDLIAAMYAAMLLGLLNLLF